MCSIIFTSYCSGDGDTELRKGLALFIGLSLALTVSACSTTDHKALDKLPKDYSYEDAIADGCVMFKNGDVTSGEAIWQEFLNAVDSGKKATVRLADYFTIEDPSRYAPELYEEVKDDYPMLFIKDLTFDGDQYITESYEDGKLSSATYKFLMKYEGEPRSDTALYYSYLYYVLVNDDTLTWDEIERGMFSSQLGAYIPHVRVYSDLAYKCGLTISPSPME